MRMPRCFAPCWRPASRPSPIVADGICQGLWARGGAPAAAFLRRLRAVAGLPQSHCRRAQRCLGYVTDPRACAARRSAAAPCASARRAPAKRAARYWRRRAQGPAKPAADFLSRSSSRVKAKVTESGSDSARDSGGRGTTLEAWSRKGRGPQQALLQRKRSDKSTALPPPSGDHPLHFREGKEAIEYKRTRAARRRPAATRPACSSRSGRATPPAPRSACRRPAGSGCPPRRPAPSTSSPRSNSTSERLPVCSRSDESH